MTHRASVRSEREPVMLSSFSKGSQPMHVEFLAIPRRLAGVSEIEVQAETLGQLLTALAKQYPALGEYIVSGRLHRAFAANLNGDQFVNDPDTALSQDDRLLILSADAGG